MNIKYLELNRISDSFQPDLSTCLCAVCDSGIYLSGERLKAFEHEYAEYTGNACCVGVGNGYDALKISLLALKDLHGWDEDSEVIVPALTFAATPLAVCHAGLKVVFSDVNEYGLMDADCAGKFVGEHTKCIIPVHLYGRMCDMNSLKNFADEHNLIMLEDAAQCHGASADGVKPGNVSAAAAFSFYPAKNLGALADAGCVVTNDAELALTVRRLANYGADVKYAHLLKGENSRLDELNAAVLSLKLRRLDADNQQRRVIARRYSSEIVCHAVKTPYNGNTECSVFHVYPILVDDRERFREYMKSRGIETAIHYPIPCHLQEAFREHGEASLPQAEDWAAREVSLPISPLLTSDEVDYIIKTVNEYGK